MDDVSRLGRNYATDRGARARAIADAFASRFPPTLPAPGSDAVPVSGRHVRLSAETPVQLYVGGEMYTRDARSRINARSGGLPVGWCVRLTLLDSAIVPCRPETPGSRADPTVLRIQRQMSDPAQAAALAAPLRRVFAGRAVHSETHSLFVPGGLAFLREASVTIALADDGDDDAMITELVGAAQDALGRAPAAAQSPPASARSARKDDSANWQRRGHLRIVQ